MNLLINLFKIIFVMYKMDNKCKKFMQMKKERREKKRTDK
jgi:hypothetical protein